MCNIPFSKATFPSLTVCQGIENGVSARLPIIIIIIIIYESCSAKSTNENDGALHSHKTLTNHNFGLLLPTVAENGVMTKGVVSGRGVDLRLRRITSSPSQTLRRRLVRTTDDGRRSECSARRLPPFVRTSSRLYFSHFATPFSVLRTL